MENKIPIYRQIEQYIMNNIEDGIYAEGMMIPSEEDFCEKFHTSRMTVRSRGYGFLYRPDGFSFTDRCRRLK